MAFYARMKKWRETMAGNDVLEANRNRWIPRRSAEDIPPFQWLVQCELKRGSGHSYPLGQATDERRQAKKTEITLEWPVEADLKI